MKRIGRHLWTTSRGGGFAPLLASLLAARAAGPLAPAGTPEGQARDGHENENAPSLLAGPASGLGLVLRW